ncbi:suppressor of cytokine signaling 7-like [Crassostrea virginica]
MEDDAQLEEIRKSGWYCGPLSYDEAISQLVNRPHGSFLGNSTFLKAIHPGIHQL